LIKDKGFISMRL